MAVSDHSPCVTDLKRLEEGGILYSENRHIFIIAFNINKYFMKAWGGIASLQLGLPIVWTEARKRGFTLAHLQKWLSEEPAKLVRLSDAKGPIRVGRDADFVVSCRCNTYE